MDASKTRRCSSDHHCSSPNKLVPTAARLGRPAAPLHGRGRPRRRQAAAGRGTHTRCVALQSPPDFGGPSPVAEEDRAVQSLVESGIRGTLACVLAAPLHVNLLDAWSPDVGAAALGLQAALPLVLLDAGLLLPDGRALAAAGKRGGAGGGGGGAGASSAPAGPFGRFAWLLGSCLSVARDTAAKYSLTGSGATRLQRAALAGAAQFSEELLARGAMLGFASMWLTARLSEAGLAGATVQLPFGVGGWIGGGGGGGGGDGPLVLDALLWAVAAGVVLGTGRRFSDCAAGRVAALEESRGAEEDAARDAARLLRYRPLAEQQAFVGRERGAAREREAASRLFESLERAAAAMLGGRAMLLSAAAYVAFFASGGNLLASFTTGLALRLATAALVDEALSSDGPQSGPA